MPWGPHYNIGLPELDRDHEELARLAGEMPQRGGDAMAGLEAAVRRHFRREERLMRRHGFPELESHRGAHRLFLRQIGAWKRDLATGARTLVEVSGQVSRWLRDHVVVADKRFGQYLERRGRVA